MVIASLLSATLLAATGATADTSAVGGEKPTCFALYTVHDGTLKLTAQFSPPRDFDPFEVTLELKSGGEWRLADSTRMVYPGYTAHFRVESWDDSVEVPYRVKNGERLACAGVIRSNPVNRDEFVVVAMSCISPREADGGLLSKSDVVANIRAIDPDLLFFAGDQVYDHSRHLEHWLNFGEDFGEALGSIPSVCLTDDHDVGQANLWGANGRACPKRDGMAGGYYMPVEYVREVERAQTSHLPDPYDPTPVEQGIGVYYTHLRWGGMSFAILEDRKFKSAPEEFNRLPGRADSITEPGYDPDRLDGPGAALLGDRQLRFLEEWTTDWSGAEMKCVLSQSPFAQMCNYSGGQERELLADFDSNGWPRSGRDRAVRLMRKSFSVHIAGDQHLGGLLQHGVDDWRDASYSFATPAIANFWLRWWDLKQPGKNREAGAPNYTGDFFDGFGNRMTVLAAANPTEAERTTDDGALSGRAAGFGVVRFNKAERTITFECWPRNVDVSDPEARQYAGWPVTVAQRDNYTAAEAPLLPKLSLAEPNQVVTVYAEDGSLVSSFRVEGAEYQPTTPAIGRYELVVGEGDDAVRLPALKSRPNNDASIDVARLSANP